MAYNQHFVRISNSKASDKRTKALEVIEKLGSKTKSATSKQLLINARKMVDKNNIDIINKLVSIGKRIEDSEARLFPLGQKEIDEILEKEISKLVANVTKRQGEAVIVMGTIK